MIMCLPFAGGGRGGGPDVVVGVSGSSGRGRAHGRGSPGRTGVRGAFAVRRCGRRVVARVLAWLPSVLWDDGWSPKTAGALLSLGTAAGLAAAWFTPGFAVRRDWEGAVAGALALRGRGWSRRRVAGARTRTSLGRLDWHRAGWHRSDGAATYLPRRPGPKGPGPESVCICTGRGYLLAAGGPLLVGVLHDLTGNWSACLIALTLLSLLLACIGSKAANATAWHRSLPADAVQVPSARVVVSPTWWLSSAAMPKRSVMTAAVIEAGMRSRSLGGAHD